MILKEIDGVIREHHVLITSTQDRAKEIAKNLNALAWHVVTADKQSQGRGMHGRVWVSPLNVNLYATFIFPLSEAKKTLLLNIPQVIAYSILEVLKKYGVQPKLKWINDVLLNKKKVAGVLCETENSSKLQDYCLVLAGVGINVNMDKKSCEAVGVPATSLMLELGQWVDKEDLLIKLTENIKANIQSLIAHGFAFFVSQVVENLEFLGKKIKVQLDNDKKTVKEGLLEGINNNGMLLLNCGNSVETFFSGRILL
jgi:BirA family biotin operon repressor/biotin-[acetyl-CoA-carboxylase] ligase